MDNYTATEQAYKNGYEQGKKDAVKHGRWEAQEYWKYENKHSILYKTNRCSLCHYDVSSRLLYNYCPNCGSLMDGGNEDG